MQHITRNTRPCAAMPQQEGCHMFIYSKVLPKKIKTPDRLVAAIKYGLLIFSTSTIMPRQPLQYPRDFNTRFKWGFFYRWTFLVHRVSSERLSQYGVRILGRACRPIKINLSTNDLIWVGRYQRRREEVCCAQKVTPNFLSVLIQPKAWCWMRQETVGFWWKNCIKVTHGRKLVRFIEWSKMSIFL